MGVQAAEPQLIAAKALIVNYTFGTGTVIPEVPEVLREQIGGRTVEKLTILTAAVR